MWKEKRKLYIWAENVTSRLSEMHFRLSEVPENPNLTIAELPRGPYPVAR